MPNTLTFEDIVEVLEQRSLPNFGKITCSIISGMCYLTGNTYPDVDLDNDFYSRRLYGTFTMYPYNTIYFYKENSWLIPFLQQNYWVKNSIIPHCSQSHDLPTIVKIKRSNGNMHDVLTNQKDYGIRIRKSSSLGDDVPRFYVRVFWINDMPVLDPSKIAEYENIYDMEMSFKDVLIEDIVKYNPQIKENGVSIKIATINLDADMSDIQKNLVAYCNNKLYNWITEVVEPAIINVAEHVKINYKIV